MHGASPDRSWSPSSPERWRQPPEQGGLDEPWIARAVVSALPDHATLVLGNSMPIRDADLFAPGDRPGRVIVNRGASGIDGLVSTAVGAALSGRPTTLLVGDLSLLHDLGGLANVRSTGADLNIVVVNNDGGGIFHFLPVAEAPGARDGFERFFGTPHGLSRSRPRQRCSDCATPASRTARRRLARSPASPRMRRSSSSA
jgi:2-succinyl-5-enolpyruvyl-6-hydroxy-3-cyclohexene-1-carboxylate synthase